MPYAHAIGARRFRFDDLKSLLAKATPARSGDALAGIAAASAEERMAARFALADLPLAAFLQNALIPYESDEITRLIVDTHDAAAFAPVAHLTVGGFRDWLLSDAANTATLAALAPGLMPEMTAAVAKLMRNQDLVLVARKCCVVTKFRNTLGLPGRLAVRLQPNHPTDDLRGIAASMLDGLLYGSGDAVIGINPASDDVAALGRLVRVLDDVISRHAIPTQSCVLTHVTNTLRMIDAGVPVDLVFQSVAGTQQANASFGVDLGVLREAHAAARSLARGTVGQNAMYFETGQGSALSAGAHHGVDQQTCEARAYAVARAFEPLLVNTVVGFIGPEYLYDGKQIVRAGLEDHFCGKLLGLPMGCDVCYTNHAEADSDDMDVLLTLLGAAGVNFVMGVPGADDIMLNYQSTSFHDALYLREVLGLKRAPEFEAWLERVGVADAAGRLLPADPQHPLLLAGLGVATSNHAAGLPAAPATAAPASTAPAPATAAPAPAAPDEWAALRTHTAARIALGRSGVSLPTAEVLAFGMAHAQARDAVHLPFDTPTIAARLEAHGFRTLEVESAAADRATYLHRPDLGRCLSPRSAALLNEPGGDSAACDVSCDVLCVVADGLSAAAVHAHAAALLLALRPRLEAAGLRIGPVVLAQQARVALGDEIGAALRARLVVVLIGERPGLSSPDSLGAYLTWAPRVGRSDAERNCVSNIRPQGLRVDEAAAKIAWLIGAAGRLGATGVSLKDESAAAVLPHAEPPLLAGR